MELVKIPKGKNFIKQDEKLKQLYLVVQGRVQQVCGKTVAYIETGNLAGLSDYSGGVYQSSYYAAEDCVLYPFPCEEPQELQAIFESQPKYALAFFQAAIRQSLEALNRYTQFEKLGRRFYESMTGYYGKYCDYCAKLGIPEKTVRGLETVTTTPDASVKPGSWELRYFKALQELGEEEAAGFYAGKYVLIVGEIMRASEAMSSALCRTDKVCGYLKQNQSILLSAHKEDLLSLYQELAVTAAEKNLLLEEILSEIDGLKAYIKASGLYKSELVASRFAEIDACDYEQIRRKKLEEKEMISQQGEEEAEDCLLHILSYAGYEEDKCVHIRELLDKYRMIEDEYASDDATRRLRKEITSIYYDTYKRIFKRSLTDKELSPIVQMFLSFGFMDVQFAGEDNANALYDLTERLEQCSSKRVHTLYEWLIGVYEGRYEPSKNEFNIDYNGYLHEQKRIGKLTEEEEQRMKQDNWEKVMFEIDNMFVSVNRAVYGKLSTFCPVLSEKDVIGEIEKLFVTAERVEAALDEVRKVDFSLFYREVIFSDPSHGINKEQIQKEILPDIILMPIIGTRAMMWQETGDIKRDTPARFVFPILAATDLSDMMLVTCGRYRWEICRKIQGMRWNDIRERSLTSEYCDYVQFYKKNHDLSVEVKEKIKNALVRAKNNYREVFVMDYVSWIKYESKGSFRLNRVARSILFRYCPFNGEIRKQLVSNPMYSELFEKYEIQLQHKKRLVKIFNEKYVKGGGEITPELQANTDFYEM